MSESNKIEYTEFDLNAFEFPLQRGAVEIRDLSRAIAKFSFGPLPVVLPDDCRQILQDTIGHLQAAADCLNALHVPPLQTKIAELKAKLPKRS